jgi:hypothetical protein
LRAPIRERLDHRSNVACHVTRVNGGDLFALLSIHLQKILRLTSSTQQDAPHDLLLAAQPIRRTPPSSRRTRSFSVPTNRGCWTPYGQQVPASPRSPGRLSN